MRLFSTDIDGTIYDGAESAAQFRDFWGSLGTGPRAPLLVYNTGRLLDDALALVERTGLPLPEFFICGVGTQIYAVREKRLVDEWRRHLDLNWNFEVVRETVERLCPARPQPAEAQNAHKCSYFWEDAQADWIAEVVAGIESHEVEVQAVYSSNRDLDFLPLRANKGNAVAWLAKHLGVPAQEVLVAGDSGNDASMYHWEGVRGIIVANAEPALVAALKSEQVYHAAKNCAAGVIEGISHLLEDRAAVRGTSSEP